MVQSIHSMHQEQKAKPGTPLLAHHLPMVQLKQVAVLHITTCLLIFKYLLGEEQHKIHIGE